jgi:hypothetical protein
MGGGVSEKQVPPLRHAQGRNDRKKSNGNGKSRETESEGLQAGFGFFCGGEDSYEGVDPGVAHDGQYAVAYAGQKKGAAIALGGDVIGGDEAEAGGVDVGDSGEIENEDLRRKGTEFCLQGKHGGEGERSRQGQDGGSLLEAGRGGVRQGGICHCDSVRARMRDSVTER